MALKKVWKMLLCNPTNTAWLFTKSPIDVLCGMVLCQIPLKLREDCLMKCLVFGKLCVLFIVSSLINFPQGGDHVRHLCFVKIISLHVKNIWLYRKRPQSNFENPCAFVFSTVNTHYVISIIQELIRLQNFVTLWVEINFLRKWFRVLSISS